MPTEPKNGIWGPKSKFGAQNQYGRVIYPSIGIFTWRKYILLGVKKAQIGPQSSITEFGAQNQYGRVIYLSIGNFKWSKKKYLGVKKAKIRFQSPKTELRPQNVKNKFLH
jgi:hypothetical protein